MNKQDFLPDRYQIPSVPEGQSGQGPLQGTESSETFILEPTTLQLEAVNEPPENTTTIREAIGDISKIGAAIIKLRNDKLEGYQ